MKRLFVCADRWMRESCWKDAALLKLCMAAIGMLLGMAVPRGKRTPVVLVAAAVFVATYIPLMGKFFGIMADEVGKPCGEE